MSKQRTNALKPKVNFDMRTSHLSCFLVVWCLALPAQSARLTDVADAFDVYKVGDEERIDAFDAYFDLDFSLYLF